MVMRARSRCLPRAPSSCALTLSINTVFQGGAHGTWYSVLTCATSTVMMRADAAPCDADAEEDHYSMGALS